MPVVVHCYCSVMRLLVDVDVPFPSCCCLLLSVSCRVSLFLDVFVC